MRGEYKTLRITEPGLPGTTSACAENTLVIFASDLSTGNYLRVRGEYLARPFVAVEYEELPPHTRRIPDKKIAQLQAEGTTSAHAENTGGYDYPIGFDGNYLRTRGEYPLPRGGEVGVKELPPHTRRIQPESHLKTGRNGTTSAHAENTQQLRVTDRIKRNYLRTRGEYPVVDDTLTMLMELPPHTRRILRHAGSLIRCQGTTSAHAENTAVGVDNHLIFRNYLRTRGEYVRSATSICFRAELPPHTRRIRALDHSNLLCHGTTSAHAENTLNELGLL